MLKRELQDDGKLYGIQLLQGTPKQTEKIKINDLLLNSQTKFWNIPERIE